MDRFSTPSWQVLLIGGNSGAGKSTAARAIGLGFGIPWLPADDLRLTLEWNFTAAQRPALHHFDDLSRVYRNPPEQVAAWRIAVAEETSRGIEIVVANHTSHGDPAVIEGDDLVPALAARRAFAGLDVEPGVVRAVFLIEDDPEVIEANMRTRGRSFIDRSPAEQRTQARASRLYGRWLAEEASRCDLPALPPRPFDTLVARILAAVE